MMAERRLVLVKEAQDLREWKSKDKLEKLAACGPSCGVHGPRPRPQQDAGQAALAVKRIQKAGVVFQSDKVRDYKLPEWIEGYVASKKRQIHPRTAQLLAEYLGNDLKKIAGEMEKLFIALPEGGEVSDSLIEQHIGISKEYNIFELTNALADKDIGRVTRIVQYMRANEKNHPVPRILPTLTNYFARVLTFHHLPNHDPSAVASALRVHPYAAKYARAARNYPAQGVPHLRLSRVRRPVQGHRQRHRGALRPAQGGALQDPALSCGKPRPSRTVDPTMTLQNDLLLRALNGEMTERPPVWVMRQAGRILPESGDAQPLSGFKELVETRSSPVR